MSAPPPPYNNPGSQPGGPPGYGPPEGKPGGQPGYGPPGGQPGGQPGYGPPGGQQGYGPPGGQPGYGPPPPPAPYHQGQPGYGQPTTVIVTQPMMSPPMRESPVGMTCPSCQKQIITSTTYQTGTLTWVACLVLCLVGCDVGCCFIPFCISSCKDTVHSCPNCRTTLGKHNRM